MATSPRSIRARGTHSVFSESARLSRRSRHTIRVAVLVAIARRSWASGRIPSHPRNTLTCKNTSDRLHSRSGRSIWKACWVKALGGSNPPSSALIRARELLRCRRRALRHVRARVARGSPVRLLDELGHDVLAPGGRRPAEHAHHGPLVDALGEQQRGGDVPSVVQHQRSTGSGCPGGARPATRSSTGARRNCGELGVLRPA